MMKLNIVRRIVNSLFVLYFLLCPVVSHAENKKDLDVVILFDKSFDANVRGMEDAFASAQYLMTLLYMGSKLDQGINVSFIPISDRNEEIISLQAVQKSYEPIQAQLISGVSKCTDFIPALKEANLQLDTSQNDQLVFIFSDGIPHTESGMGCDGTVDDSSYIPISRYFFETTFDKELRELQRKAEVHLFTVNKSSNLFSGVDQIPHLDSIWDRLMYGKRQYHSHGNIMEYFEDIENILLSNKYLADMSKTKRMSQKSISSDDLGGIDVSAYNMLSMFYLKLNNNSPIISLKTDSMNWSEDEDVVATFGSKMYFDSNMPPWAVEHNSSIAWFVLGKMHIQPSIEEDQRLDIMPLHAWTIGGLIIVLIMFVGVYIYSRNENKWIQNFKKTRDLRNRIKNVAKSFDELSKAIASLTALEVLDMLSEKEISKHVDEILKQKNNIFSDAGGEIKSLFCLSSIGENSKENFKEMERKLDSFDLQDSAREAFLHYMYSNLGRKRWVQNLELISDFDLRVDYEVSVIGNMIKSRDWRIHQACINKYILNPKINARLNQYLSAVSPKEL